MKKFISLLLLLPALSAHAEISLIKKMTHAECMQVIRDSLDMYNDMEFCEKNTNEETQRNGMLAWNMAGFANSKSAMAPICPTVKKMTKQEQTEIILNLMNPKRLQNSAPRKTVTASPSFIQNTISCS